MSIAKSVSQSLIFCFLTIVFFACTEQQELNEGKLTLEEPRYGYSLSGADSISYLFEKELIQKGVNQIMIFHYDFDNGRVEEGTRYILWLENDKSFMKIIKGIDSVTTSDIISLPGIKNVFKFYHENRIDTITSWMEMKRAPSHGMGYYITVYLPQGNKYYNIRDYHRGLGYNMKGEQIQNVYHDFLHDRRVMWVNLFEKTMSKYLRQKS